MSNPKAPSMATEELLSQLHGLAADSFLRELEAYGPEGKRAGEPIPPALLGQAIKFLKDNGIDAPRKPGGKLDRLANDLPRFDDEPLPGGIRLC